MKLIVPAFAVVAALALVMFALLVPAPIITSKAFATKMDGKPYSSNTGGHPSANASNAFRRRVTSERD
jgi:hypothetical protein